MNIRHLSGRENRKSLKYLEDGKGVRSLFSLQTGVRPHFPFPHAAQTSRYPHT